MNPKANYEYHQFTSNNELRLSTIWSNLYLYIYFYLTMQRIISSTIYLSPFSGDKF